MGLQETIALSFLTVGHTKFSPDWCLGLFKRRHRHTRISCLYDKVCEKLRVKAAKGGKAKSCVVLEQSAEVNAVQFAGAQDGTVIVPTYDWADHFTLHSARVPYGASNTLLHESLTRKGVCEHRHCASVAQALRWRCQIGKCAAVHLCLTCAKREVWSRGVANNKWVGKRNILGPQNVQYDQTTKIMCLEIWRYTAIQ